MPSFDNTYARLPSRLYARVKPTKVAEPRVLAVNGPLAALVGWDPRADEDGGAGALSGNRVPEGAEPIALAYAGHQFGSFVPSLGDGRAVLLGELVGQDGRRYDVQLKGAGPTPFSRGGDGRAALGPVLREYVVSEAMAALGVPTTRALAAVATGEPVYRETRLPGAVLTRVASSHLRVGTFQYFAARDDLEALEALTAYALARHYPGAPAHDRPALTLLDAVCAAQARLVARWLALGFVHGVMNTDNTSISGETIDYGPCAFLDGFDRARTFSSIDRGGRYAFGRQPRVMLWNLARLADALLPLTDDDDARAVARATEILERYPERFEAAYEGELRLKLGLSTARDGDAALGERALEALEPEHVDYTIFWRRLADAIEQGDDAPVEALFVDREPIAAWLGALRSRLAEEPRGPAETALAMRRASPRVIPRNHRVEELIARAVEGDLGPFERMMRVLARPYDDEPGSDDLAEPPGSEQWRYRTFCGT